jgi:nitroimidazol reductase NimA-like FMN-containing flavoprotein (pyridoxamine 5'-phosphate oxidase superfamily)
MVTGPGAGSEFTTIELERRQCLELLAQTRIGRVVLSVDCIPVALPVNVAVLDGDVVFATGAGSKFDAAIRGQVVSVEADHIDPLYHTGWSVLVTGVAQVLTDDADLARAAELPLQAWAPGSHPFLVRVPTTLVSGRRLDWGGAGDPRSVDDGRTSARR